MPSFVLELALQTSSKEEALLRKRFWAAKQQYNALLGETLRRLAAMRKDDRYQEAHKLYKIKGKKIEARALFKQAAEESGYREYDLYGYTKQWNKKGNPLSIGARISQKLAKRAFQAVKEYETGKRGRPRFKGYRGIGSIEDSSIDANLRLKEQTIHYLGIQLPLLYDVNDMVHCHGLSAKAKYIRLVQRQYRCKTRYFAQIICEGYAYQKEKNLIADGQVGLDIGPQTIAIVSVDKKTARLKVFADQIKRNQEKKLLLQRKLARQLRASNLPCFREDQWVKKDKHWVRKKGTNIKGKRINVRSKGLVHTQGQLRTLLSKEAGYRKSAHGKLINEILALGNQIQTEKLSYKAFQKLFGRSVGLRAPGLFLEKLRRKAENAGGKVTEFSTWSTKLSQACQCGRVEKKSLAQRWHSCPCGAKAQRDLYSAYLACFVEKDKLMVDQAQKAWSGIDIALRMAMSELKHSISGACPTSLGIKPGSENVMRNVS